MKKISILAREFVTNELMRDPWFKVLYENGIYSLLFLTGSSVHDDSDEFSDIDLFLVCPHQVQIDHELAPVYEYDYQNYKVEVSLVSTEKLIYDQTAKTHAHWWNNYELILSTDTRFSKALDVASSFSNEEKINHLWSNYVLFRIALINMQKLILRKDSLGFEILFYDSIKNICEFLLLDKNKVRHSKWFGILVKEYFPLIYSEIESIRQLPSNEERLSALHKFFDYFLTVLLKNGFTKFEIYNWDKHSVHRINFQRY